jgi:hypothetical protein
MDLAYHALAVVSSHKKGSKPVAMLNHFNTSLISKIYCDDEDG